jgi:hypothetical protein
METSTLNFATVTSNGWGPKSSSRFHFQWPTVRHERPYHVWTNIFSWGLCLPLWSEGALHHSKVVVCSGDVPPKFPQPSDSPQTNQPSTIINHKTFNGIIKNAACMYLLPEAELPSSSIIYQSKPELLSEKKRWWGTEIKGTDSGAQQTGDEIRAWTYDHIKLWLCFL